MKAVRGEGSLGEAIVASLLVGLLVALGAFGATAFLAVPYGVWIPVALGALIAAFMLWLFLTRALRVQDIWQAIKDFRA